MSKLTFRRVAMTVGFIQLPMLWVIFWGEFGFYFPGAMGGISAWLSWILVYFIVAVSGIVMSMRLKLTRLTQVQIAAPFVMAFCHWAYFAIPEPHYDAASYQHLLGMTYEEVESEISERHILTSGYEGYEPEGDPPDQWPSLGFQDYNGMTILFSEAGRVVEVREE